MSPRLLDEDLGLCGGPSSKSIISKSWKRQARNHSDMSFSDLHNKKRACEIRLDDEESVTSKRVCWDDQSLESNGC